MMLNKTFHLILLSLIPIFGFSQANSQYPDSGNKIRLGFQTTSDGLIWRDTQPKVGGYQPINNKAAWIILDTMNNKFYHYKNSTWTLAGGQDIDTANLIATKYNLGFKLSLADTQNMLTPYWRSGRFSGVLPVENGGTGQSTLTANKVMVGNVTSGVLTPTDLHWDNSNALLGIGETSLSTFKLTVKGAFPILFNTTATANTLTYGGTRFFRNTSTLNNGNGFQYSFNDANGNAAEYGYFGGYIIDNTVGSTDGGFIFAPTLNNSRTEAMRILNNGNVGIGVPNPTEKLHVSGNGLFTGSMSLGTPLSVANGGTGTTSIGGENRLVYASSATQMATSSNLNIVFVGPTPYFSVITGALRMRNQAQLQFFNATNGYAWAAVVKGSTWQFQDNPGNSIMQMRGIAQRVGIGYEDTLFIDEKFVVNGNARITGAYDVTTASTANVFVSSTGLLQRSTSSIKYKTDVEDYSKGLKEVMQLRPVTFKSINSNNDKTYAGFIAEELADLKLNELVENNDSGEPDAISYAYMVTLLTKAIQEQQEQISQLKKRLLILENK